MRSRTGAPLSGVARRAHISANNVPDGRRNRAPVSRPGSGVRRERRGLGKLDCSTARHGTLDTARAPATSPGAALSRRSGAPRCSSGPSPPAGASPVASDVVADRVGARVCPGGSPSWSSWRAGPSGSSAGRMPGSTSTSGTSRASRPSRDSPSACSAAVVPKSTLAAGGLPAEVGGELRVLGGGGLGVVVGDLGDAVVLGELVAGGLALGLRHGRPLPVGAAPRRDSTGRYPSDGIASTAPARASAGLPRVPVRPTLRSWSVPGRRWRAGDGAVDLAGAVSFGLVTIGVKLYSATEDNDIRFHQVHATDGGRVKYRRVCSIDGEEVEYRDIAKGYELPDGQRGRPHRRRLRRAAAGQHAARSRCCSSSTRPRSTRSTSRRPTTSSPRAPRRAPTCCCATRWRTPARSPSPRSRSGSASRWPRCGCATASWCCTPCAGPTRSGRPTSASWTRTSPSGRRS